MLCRLHIERFALIDQLELSVKPGFTVLTGETGAGKSIFLGALQLALGGRAEFASIGQPGFKSVVEAEFRVPSDRQSDLGSTDWDWWSEGSDASLVLRREVHPGGRSRAFINDSPVRLDELRRVSSSLVDIHSQRDEGLWARNEGIVLLLEAFADGHQAAKGHYQTCFAQLRQAEERLLALESELGAVNDPEYLKFVVEELRALDLKLGEEAKLREQLKLLSNQQELQELSAEALAAVDREELGLESLAGQLRKLGERAERLGVSNDQLTSMGYALEDLVRELRGHWQDLVDQLDANPGELNFVEERLSAIDRVQRKHQCADDSALIAHWETLERRLKVWTEGAEELERARAEVREASLKVSAAGEDWNQILMKAEPAMVAAVTRGLADLAMAQTRIAVRAVRRSAPSPMGTYTYTLEFSANPGQELQELAKVASGGERSRLMLVLKRYLAERKGLSTVLFDEIDTGVSGATASKMAHMLRSMSQNAQIIAITHLPQVAALGSQHWVVEKLVDGDRTLTQLKTLSDSDRAPEVARLLSDGDLSALAMAQAEALMAAAE